MSLNDTPRADRLHIGIFGRRNSGKSSLVNRLTGQDIALVSDAPGTTTDPVYKSMELHPIGPVVFVDTAGFDDEGELGELRIQRTCQVMDKIDVAILVVDASCGNVEESINECMDKLEDKDVPKIIVLNKMDVIREGDEACSVGVLGAKIIAVSARTGEGIDDLRQAISDAVPEDYMRRCILGNLVDEGALVLLVMPQDIQAPKGRLILPQVQTLRELLDRHCTTVATTADGFTRALECLNAEPDLIITDSQCFRMVYDNKPINSKLTSFSVLFAAYKGDINVFVEGASAIDKLTENSKVLIAEACTHVPLQEDIGTVKIPRLLRAKVGENLTIVNVKGNDFPEDDLESYDLIIHCGACMFNRAHVMNRIDRAKAANVPITNYGVVIAKLSGIICNISLPC